MSSQTLLRNGKLYNLTGAPVLLPTSEIQYKCTLANQATLTITDAAVITFIPQMTVEQIDQFCQSNHLEFIESFSIGAEVVTIARIKNPNPVEALVDLWTKYGPNGTRLLEDLNHNVVEHVSNF